MDVARRRITCNRYDPLQPRQRLVELIKSITVPRLLEYIHILSIWRRSGIERPSLVLCGTHVPRVDIFIAYCGEGTDLVLDTVKATCALDYPDTSFRIIVLDDSSSEDLASAISTQFQSRGNVYYTTRGEKISTHSKAGNLNWGLRYTALQQDGPSEFLAVLDVDMIPTPGWLRILLPHLLQNEHTAMVSPPQNYYNVPRDDRYDEGLFFVRHQEVVTPLLDRSGNAMCTGTGFVARREAIDSIGGFPTQSVAEGVLTSWKLKAAGWQGVYVPERVQWGLGPQTIQSYIRQCEKTAVGAASLNEQAMQRTEKGTRAPLSQTIAPKLILLLYTLPFWTGTLNMLVIPYVLLVGGFGSGFTSLLHPARTTLILSVIDFVSQCGYGSTISSVVQGRLYVMNHLASLWTAPHQLLALVSPPALLRRFKPAQRQQYVPTNKASEAESRQIAKTWLSRVRDGFSKDLILVHGTVFSVCILSAVFWTTHILNLNQGMEDRSSTPTAVLSRFLSTIGWPPFFVLWTAYAANAWTPVSCLLFPPARPPREHLLIPHPDTGAPCPSQEAKQGWFRRKRGAHFYLLVAYHAVVAALLFF